MNFELGPDKLPGTYDIDHNRFIVMLPDGHWITWDCLDWPDSVIKMPAEKIWDYIGETVTGFKEML